MTNINRTALVPFSVEKMFELVNDCESYPKFLYGCRNAKLIYRDNQTLIGELELGKAGIHVKFRTKNSLYPYERIKLRLENGPFKKFEGEWLFHKLADDACKISLNLTFEFKNNFTNLAANSVFSQISNKIVDSFVQRARLLHGKTP